MIGMNERLIESQINKWIVKPRGKIFFVDGSAGDNNNVVVASRAVYDYAYWVTT